MLPGLGGTAYHNTPGGAVELAVVSAAGLLGPPVVGGIMLVLTRRLNFGRQLLIACAALCAYTGFSLAADDFTQLICFCGGVAFGLVGAIRWNFAQSLLVQIIAIQLMVESVLDWDYAWIESFTRDGEVWLSDTGKIAHNIGGTHWFWASVLCGIIILIVGIAWSYSFRRTG